MFGYVNVYKDLLLVRDYNTFRGYYCGLCKQLGESFNQLTRLGLSYDMTFLAVLISSLNDKKVCAGYERCVAHPLSKRPVIRGDAGIEYAADISVILTYLKLKDDWHDEKSVKSLARVFYLRPFKKAALKHRKKYEIISECMGKLNKLEAENCQNPDEAADCFGKLLESVFDIDGKNRALRWLGYNIGRFIYLVDAYSDIDRDIKNKCYNPFLSLADDREALKNGVKDALLLTLTEIANAYNLLDIKKNNEILDNFIYVGLRNNLEKL